MCQGQGHTHKEWEKPVIDASRPIRIGIGGPVGSGKTALVERLSRSRIEKYSVAVITNDIYTKEDARILVNTGVLPEENSWGRDRRLSTYGDPRGCVDELRSD